MKGEEGKENLLEICLPQAHFRHITHKNSESGNRFL